MGERWRYWRRCRRQDRARREAFRANGDRFYGDPRTGVGVYVIGNATPLDPATAGSLPSASLFTPAPPAPAPPAPAPPGDPRNFLADLEEPAYCLPEQPARKQPPYPRPPGADPRTGTPLSVEAVREWALTEPDEDTANATVRRLLEVYDDTTARLRALAEGTPLRAEDGPAELTVADYDDLNAAATAAARRMFWLEGAMAKVAAILDTAEGEPAREVRDVLATHVAPTCGHHYGTVTGCAACVAAAAASARLRERG